MAASNGPPRKEMARARARAVPFVVARGRQNLMMIPPLKSPCWSM